VRHARTLPLSSSTIRSSHYFILMYQPLKGTVNRNVCQIDIRRRIDYVLTEQRQEIPRFKNPPRSATIFFKRGTLMLLSDVKIL
jgi:hypothetical protein